MLQLLLKHNKNLVARKFSAAIGIKRDRELTDLCQFPGKADSVDTLKHEPVIEARLGGLQVGQCLYKFFRQHPQACSA
jgi:hypothetical protein